MLPLSVTDVVVVVASPEGVATCVPVTGDVSRDTGRETGVPSNHILHSG